MTGVGTVTVLFTDLVGSTALASEIGDIEVSGLRQSHFAALRAAATATGGEEVKNLGDGLMIVYRGASDAIDGAVAMQRAVARGNLGGGVPLAMKVGISVGDISEEDGDWFGTPVNEAARLCAAAVGGQVLIADIVRVLAGSRTRHAIEPAGTRELKGLPEPVVVCEVRWAASTRRLEVELPALFGGVARPFVGRVAERSRLADAWAAATDGQTAAVLIGGEPGVGKTFLASAAACAAHEDGGVVLLGRCDEMLAAPFRPWIEALRVLVSALDGPTLRDWAGVRTRELSRLVPEVTGLIADLEPPSSGDPESERFALFEAVTGLLSGAASEAPLCLVLDDLHWADSASLLLLRHVLRRADARRLLVIGTYRDSEVQDGSTLAEVLADLRRDRSVERLRLEGLDRDTTRDLLSTWAGQDVPATFATSVHAETGGNPFFVEEVIDALRERGTISRSETGWVPPTALDVMPVPAGVLELVRRRASRLARSTQALLEVAALTGREFEVAVVAEAADVKEDELLDALEEAMVIGLVREVEGQPDRFRFEHALTRAALEESIITGRRARLHLRIGEVLEARHPTDVATLAHHYVEATAAGARKAFDYTVRAARAALDTLAYEEAVSYASLALRSLELIDDPDPLACVDLQLLLAEAHTSLSNSEPAHVAAVAAADGARALGDSPRFVRAVFLYGLSGAVAADAVRSSLVDEALTLLPETDSADRAMLLSTRAAWQAITDPRGGDLDGARAALEMAHRVGDDRAIAQAASAVQDLLVGRPQARERIAMAAATIAAAERSGFDRGLLNSLQWHPPAFLELGDRRAFEVALADMEHRARAHHLDHKLVVLSGCRSLLLQIDGRFEEADRHGVDSEAAMPSTDPNALLARLAQRVALARELGQSEELLPQLEMIATLPEFPGVLAEVGYWYLTLDRRDEARAVLERFVGASFSTIPNNWGRPSALHDLAELAAALRHTEAAAALLPMLDPYQGTILVAYGVAGCRGAADRMRGRLLALAGRHDEAVAALHAAIALEGSVNGRALLPRTWTAFAQVLLEQDQPAARAEAVTWLNRAAAEAEALEMGGLVREIDWIRAAHQL